MVGSSTNSPNNRAADALRRGELLLWFVWSLGTLLISDFLIATKLFLVYLYGWTRVWKEHLSILSMPKGHPWPVSNGDLIYGPFEIHYFVGVFCWFVLFFSTYFFVRRLLPPRRPSA